MATTKEINIIVNTEKAEKPTKDLKKSFDNLSDSVEKQGKESQKTIDKTEK